VDWRYYYYGADGEPLDDVSSVTGATLDQYVTKGTGAGSLIATTPWGTRKYVVTDPLGSRTTTSRRPAPGLHPR
jgi:hypothetical protein